eukprot:CAMPEP_0167742198 /NCGR_PEP_ID=MMETSP0110_2-20121227/1289_1 /TAXON_ID=629695 /ORGANISM="Gymnochlora sp., Strain CCMP2014" /LENGTH=263 /DNA_ID=CAMNT_0007626355 /DNA_START=133 /DNA_END=921 /DNA_ORIENTATION=+
MKPLQDTEIAVVTGASKGIGKAIAGDLAQRGFNVLLVARSEDKLKSLAERLMKEHNVKAYHLPLDLTLEHSEKKILLWLKERKLHCGILINNAGCDTRSDFHLLPSGKLDLMIDLNVVASTRVLRALLPQMIRKDKGRIMMVSSIAGTASQPSNAVYAATKAYISSLTYSLQVELRNTNVHVLCLEPGATYTDFAEEAGITNSLIMTIPTLQVTAEYVAKYSVDSLVRGHKKLVTGWFSKLALFSGWLFPQAMVSILALVFWS